MNQKVLTFFFILLTNIAFNYSYGQQWSSIDLKITSAHGDNKCHNVDKDYTFSFKVDLPAKTVTSVSRGVTRTEEYTVVLKSPSQQTMITTGGYKAAIYEGSSQINRKASIQKGALKSGTFKLRYDEAWRASEISLRLVAYVQYQLSETIANQGTNIINTSVQAFAETFTFQLSPFLGKPQLSINGAPASSIDIDPLNPCQEYELSIPPVEGAERYNWNLSNSSWLISPQSSLTSRSIRVRPAFIALGKGTVNVGSITVQAIQACDGDRIKEASVDVNIKYPDIQASRPVACFENNTETILSIPSPAPGVNIQWYVDANKVEIVGGQGTNTLRIKAKGDFKTLSTINVLMSTDGSLSCNSHLLTSIDIWLGKPTQVLTDPSGYPTVTISSSGFKNFRVTNHSTVQGITNYSWWVSPNQLSLFPSTLGTPNCTVLGDVAGNFNLYVTRSNACGASPVGGGALHVESGSYGGSGPVDPRSPEKHSNSEIQSLSVYPNPADKLARLRFVGANGDDLNIENIRATILDLSGREIATTRNNAFDVSELPTGIYLIKVDTGDKIRSTKLIVK